MKSIKYLRDYILENYVNEFGNLDIQGLDFSEFDGNVYIGGMKVRGHLFQDGHKVQGNLYQGGQKVEGNLYQGGQEVQGSLYQGGQEVQGNLFQSVQEVQGNLFQSWQKAEGNYHCENVQVKGDIYTNEPTKLLKEVTAEELAELGYKLKGEN